jgi:hypothetical protein
LLYNKGKDNLVRETGKKYFMAAFPEKCLDIQPTRHQPTLQLPHPHMSIHAV